MTVLYYHILNFFSTVFCIRFRIIIYAQKSAENPCHIQHNIKDFIRQNVKITKALFKSFFL